LKENSILGRHGQAPELVPLSTRSGAERFAEKEQEQVAPRGGSARTEERRTSARNFGAKAFITTPHGELRETSPDVKTTTWWWQRPPPPVNSNFWVTTAYVRRYVSSRFRELQPGLKAKTRIVPLMDRVLCGIVQEQSSTPDTIECSPPPAS
jgi:hypothetical protein